MAKSSEQYDMFFEVTTTIQLYITLVTCIFLSREDGGRGVDTFTSALPWHVFEGGLTSSPTAAVVVIRGLWLLVDRYRHPVFYRHLGSCIWGYIRVSISCIDTIKTSSAITN